MSDVVEKIKQAFGELDNEFKRILDEIERGCFKRQIDVFDDFVSEVSNAKTKVLKVLSSYTIIEKQKLQLNESDPDKYPLFNQRLQQHGYTLYKVTHFEDHDRIHFGNSDIEVSLNLRGKLGLLALDEVIEACMRSLHKKEWIGKVEK